MVTTNYCFLKNLIVKLSTLIDNVGTYIISRMNV